MPGHDGVRSEPGQVREDGPRGCVPPRPDADDVARAAGVARAAAVGPTVGGRLIGLPPTTGPLLGGPAAAAALPRGTTTSIAGSMFALLVASAVVPLGGAAASGLGPLTRVTTDVLLGWARSRSTDAVGSFYSAAGVPA